MCGAWTLYRLSWRWGPLRARLGCQSEDEHPLRACGGQVVARGRSCRGRAAVVLHRIANGEAAAIVAGGSVTLVPVRSAKLLSSPYTAKLFCVPMKTFPSAAMGVAK